MQLFRRDLAGFQHVAQVAAGMACLYHRDRFRGACGHNFAAAIAALGADINDPIGGLDHIKVMFDHDHGVALIDQFVQHLQQLFHVFEMQARGGFIKDIKRASGRAAGKFL